MRGRPRSSSAEDATDDDDEEEGEVDEEEEVAEGSPARTEGKQRGRHCGRTPGRSQGDDSSPSDAAGWVTCETSATPSATWPARPASSRRARERGESSTDSSKVRPALDAEEAPAAWKTARVTASRTERRSIEAAAASSAGEEARSAVCTEGVRTSVQSRIPWRVFESARSSWRSGSVHSAMHTRGRLAPGLVRRAPSALDASTPSTRSVRVSEAPSTNSRRWSGWASHASTTECSRVTGWARE